MQRFAYDSLPRRFEIEKSRNEPALVHVSHGHTGFFSAVRLGNDARGQLADSQEAPRRSITIASLLIGLKKQLLSLLFQERAWLGGGRSIAFASLPSGT